MGAMNGDNDTRNHATTCRSTCPIDGAHPCMNPNLKKLALSLVVVLMKSQGDRNVVPHVRYLPCNVMYNIVLSINSFVALSTNGVCIARLL